MGNTQILLLYFVYTGGPVSPILSPYPPGHSIVLTPFALGAGLLLTPYQPGTLTLPILQPV
jgi:hypothetical protein